MKNLFIYLFVLNLFCIKSLNAIFSHKRDGRSNNSHQNERNEDRFKFNLKPFTPSKKNNTPLSKKESSTKDTPSKEKPSIPGSFKQKAFLSSVFSYGENVKYNYGSEGDKYMDCSSFVQYVLEKKGCIDIPYRLTSGSNMKQLFGPAKTCSPGDIVRTGGHMGFYWSPGYYVGNNSGQNGVGVHVSSGTCYPNPCINKFRKLTI